MGGRIALHVALALGPERVARLVLVGASPGIADPAERARAAAPTTRRSPTGSRRSTIEAFAREWGAQPLFAGTPNFSFELKKKSSSMEIQSADISSSSDELFPK